MKRTLLWSAVLALAAASVGCENSPDPTRHSDDLRVSEEVYRIFCKRAARNAYTREDTGVRFNGPCERAGAGALAAAGVVDPATLDPSARAALAQSGVDVGYVSSFRALVARRPEIVAALDQVFGELPVAGLTEAFAKGQGDTGELDQLLKNMVPFYDDGTTPASTRAIAAMAKQLAEPTDPRAQDVLKKLAELSGRQGYRAPGQTLAATRPMLAYPGLDDVSEKLLAILGAGGPGNDVFLKLLEAAALELADKSKDVPNADSALRVATDLFMRSLRAPGAVPPADAPADWQPPLFPEARATTPQYFVRRDDTGNAISAGGGGTPFPVTGRVDPAANFRDADGKLGSFKYGNSTETLLAALLREQKPLLQRKAPGQPSTVEKILRGIRPLLGPSTGRNYTFTSGRAYAFQGPDVTKSPLLDLLHSVATLLQYPQTESVLALLTELLDKYETDASGPVYASLAIDADADQDKNAKLTGLTPTTQSEFWDDLIDLGSRMLEPGREGMLEAVLRTFGEPSSPAQVALLAKFMANKDVIPYNGYPNLKPGTDGKYTSTDEQTLNAEIKAQIQTPVDRTQPDVGMNRSLFQRLTSMINVTNGAKVCTKEGAKLTVAGPLGDLSFPNGDALQMGIIGCSGADVAIYSARGTTGYPACGFISQSNAAVTQMLSILGKGSNRPHDPQMLCAAKAVGQDVASTQETAAQVKGFTLSPTPEALSRFIGAPRNKFLTDLFAPQPTKDGVPLVEYEPFMLFSLEPKQDDVLLNGKPTNFLEVSKDLLKAFDDHEIVVDDKTTFDQPQWPKGYLFAELLTTLGKHWPSPRAEDCPATVQQGNEGCTQHLDPTKPFYAPQSNLVSYEPLLIKAFQDHKLGDILYKATARLKDIWIGTDSATGRPVAVAANTAGAKDGIAVLADFLKFALTPDAALADRLGNKSTHTNACVPMNGVDPATNQPVTTCANGVGRIIPQTTPLYLLLDALNTIDTLWKDPANTERHDTWLAGRSELIDTLLTVDRDATDPTNPVYRMRDQRGRALAIQVLGWLRTTMLTDKHPLTGDRVAWATGANGLAKRLGDTLGHPLVAYGLDLFDVVWKDPSAGDALAAMNTYLMDFENNENAFLGVALAAADALEFADREPNLAPVIQFGALAVAPNALAAIAPNGPAPDVKAGAAYTGLELTRKVALLPAYKGMPALSPLAKILKNAVITPAGGRAPIEVLFDAIADVNRTQPEVDTTVPHSATDNQQVFNKLQQFMLDPDRGLERLYTVIKGRKLGGAQ